MGLFGRWAQRRRQGRAAADQPWSQVRFTVLDTELTGLDDGRDDLIAIGAVRMRGGSLAIGGTFHELVRPSAILDGRTVVIHRITPDELATRPGIATVLPAFLAYAGDTVLVGHCLGLDLAFLNREARRLTGAPLANELLDTLALYGWLRHRHQGHPAFHLPLCGLSLSVLAEAFDIAVAQAHTALGDATMTALLFQRFLPMLNQAGVTRLGELLSIGHPLRQAENLLAPGGQMLF